MEQNPNTSLDFYGTNGRSQQLTSNLEFISRSLYELEVMLDENVRMERYEKCARIRDEIIRRALLKKND